MICELHKCPTSIFVSGIRLQRTSKLQQLVSIIDTRNDNHRGWDNPFKKNLIDCDMFRSIVPKPLPPSFFPAYMYVIQMYVRLNEIYRSDSSLCDYSVRVPNL